MEDNAARLNHQNSTAINITNNDYLIRMHAKHQQSIQTARQTVRSWQKLYELKKQDFKASNGAMGSSALANFANQGTEKNSYGGYFQIGIYSIKSAYDLYHLFKMDTHASQKIFWLLDSAFTSFIPAMLFIATKFPGGNFINDQALNNMLLGLVALANQTSLSALESYLRNSEKELERQQLNYLLFITEESTDVENFIQMQLQSIKSANAINLFSTDQQSLLAAKQKHRNLTQPQLNAGFINGISQRIDEANHQLIHITTGIAIMTPENQASSSHLAFYQQLKNNGPLMQQRLEKASMGLFHIFNHLQLSDPGSDYALSSNRE